MNGVQLAAPPLTARRRAAAVRRRGMKEPEGGKGRSRRVRSPDQLSRRREPVVYQGR